MKTLLSRFAIAAAMTACASLRPSSSLAGIFEYKDALDLAVTAPDELTAEQRTDRLDLYLGDDFSYDDNLYRVPSSFTDLTTLPGIGPNPRRQDYIDSVTAGLDSEWLVANRQSVDLSLRADDNRYFRNTDLNNVSSSDHLAWNWGVGSALSGSVGADYHRILGGFVNTGIYSRNIVSTSDYFASMRLQAGPRWGIFGGIMDQDFSLSEATYNNSKTKAVDIGTDYATGASNRIGIDYRYTDDRSPNAAVLNGISFDPDYREDRARLLFHYLPSEKTTINASAGYLRRQYPSTAIGGFSGEIWRASLLWQATPKTGLVVGTWRQVNADLTSQTDYYVSRGGTIGPTWTPSEKITLTFAATEEYQDYLGSNPVGPNAVALSLPGRRDTVSTQTANMAYTISRALSLSITAAHENRNSNTPQFKYNDFRGDVSLTYKFFRYGGAL